MNRKGTASLALLAPLVMGMSACGGNHGSAVVTRVDGTAITQATVDRWAGVVQRGGAFTGFRGAPRVGTPKQRALTLLISSSWLVGEAARQGAAVSAKEVNDALAERMQGGAAAEFHKRLRSSGQTPVGSKLELRAELALEAIREALTRRVGQVSQSSVARFYRQGGWRMFSTPKVAVVDIVENIPSAAAATALVKRVGTGRAFAKIAWHKKLAYTSGVLSGAASKKEVDYAIFAARPGVVSRPMRFFNGWAVFVVRRVIPPRPRPLAEVRAQVIAAYKEQRMREVFGAFAREYARRWVAKTSCRSGYVVPGCAQYGGALGSYENPFSVTP
jgi:foldase protein PrsA